MKPGVIRLFAAAFVILVLEGGARAADEKEPAAEVQDAFKRFATAVKDDKYEEASRWIAPPADKVWANCIALRPAAGKYDAALQEKFGKSDKSLLQYLGLGEGGLAKHYYETRGDIRGVKGAGKDRVHVTVWTKGPIFEGGKEDAIYERTFTAIKLDGEWKFQLHLPIGGSPVVKKVQRTAPDGKKIEVYAEHYPRGGADPKNWLELKPISYDGREEELKQEAAQWARFAEVVPAQTEAVRRGTYKSRDEALEALRKALRGR